MIYNETVECADAATLAGIQLNHLRRLIPYVYAHAPFYRRKLDEAGVRPEDIRSLEDVRRLPFTVKDDLRDHYPFGLFSQPIEQVSEIHVSSGTTGNPTVVGYTKEDLQLWGSVMARALACAGAAPGDMIQIAYGYGLFTGGLGAHYGALELGLTILPMSSGQTKRQLKLMQDFRPRILACTPSYALFMREDAKEMGLDPRQSSWEIGVFGAEPWSEPMREEIQKTWNLCATDIYGLSEIIGPGVAQECPHRCGLHLFADVFYPEIIHPDTGEPVPDGEYGELVITTLTKRALPLLRYRTRDLVAIHREKCACGRTLPRISKIKGRTDDMIIVRGINVFPSQIEHVLLGIKGIEPHYQLVVSRAPGGLDDLEVRVEVEERFFSDEVKALQALSERIRREIESTLGIGAKVKLVEPKTIERSIGKAKRVVDQRHL